MVKLPPGRYLVKNLKTSLKGIESVEWVRKTAWIAEVWLDRLYYGLIDGALTDNLGKAEKFSSREEGLSWARAHTRYNFIIKQTTWLENVQ